MKQENYLTVSKLVDLEDPIYSRESVIGILGEDKKLEDLTKADAILLCEKSDDRAISVYGYPGLVGRLEQCYGTTIAEGVKVILGLDGENLILEEDNR